MAVFYLFAAVSLWLGLMSLWSGIRFARYVKRELKASLPAYAPFVSVIAPCRGLDQGLAQNVSALLQQEYPRYDLLFVTGTKTDEAIPVIEQLRTSLTGIKAGNVRLLVAGEAVGCGQKVHNLRHATQALSAKTEVLVFVDSDARVSSNWLRSLVAPLSNADLGATTGYRWFVPVKGGFASQLRSVWNASIASALGEDTMRNFCWGGSTAIRRSVFEQLNVHDGWRGSVSDDFTVTRVLQQAQRPVYFVPECLVPTFEDCSLTELLTFTNRQLQITRVYAPHLWKLLFSGSAVFVVTFFGGIALVVTRAFSGQMPYVAASIVLAIFVLGALKAFLRFRVIDAIMRQQRQSLSSGLLPHLLLWPISALLQLINCVVAAMSRRIRWRGITYELKSPNETVIIARE